MRLTQDTDLSVLDLVITKHARFTKAEDEMILKYVSEYGYHTQVFKILSTKLKSRIWQVVQKRYDRIISDSPEKPNRKFRQVARTCKPWTLEEDEQLIKFLLKVMSYHANIIITYYYISVKTHIRLQINVYNCISGHVESGVY